MSAPDSASPSQPAPSPSSRGARAAAEYAPTRAPGRRTLLPRLTAAFPLATVLATALATACTTGLDLDAPLTDAERTFAHADGELLMARANCTACHAADDATLERLRPLAAPRLGGIGWRTSPEWLADWMDHGCSLRPGTRMPDMLHDLTDREQRAEVVDELVHFLMTLGGGYETRPSRPQDWDVERGAALFDELGCRACHEAGLDGDLAAKTDLARLTEFLLDPLRHRPAGLMPDMALDHDEARALSSWLLQEQLRAGPPETSLAPGLEVTAYEIPFWPAELPDWELCDVVSVSSATRIDTAAAPRDEQFGLVFRGEVLIPETGEQGFFLVSDDGSRLSVDGQVVIDHDGHHSPTRKDGRVTLDAGWHELVIEMFEAGGGEAIDAGFVDAAGDDHAFGRLDLRHLVTRSLPRGHAGPVAIDQDKVYWGRIRFKMRRCGACHEVASVPARTGPDLAALEDLDGGCLADEVPGRLPDYRFTPRERRALRETLAQRRALRAPLPPQAEVDHALARLDCLACHPRDGAGGPSPSVRAAFVETADLGDEGRLPPDLTGVGGRLRREWLADLFDGGPAASVRPYMPARMPSFGAHAVAGLADALVATDAPPAAPPEPGADAASVSAGRSLAGSPGGLDCISCHGVLGHEGTGLPGLDLGNSAQRMTWPGFHQWLSDPIARRAGTRMPSFFDEGQSVQGKVLEGDAEAQIAALWTWLSLGTDMPLPTGLVVDRSDYLQVAVDHPVYVSLFMADLSARVLAVGFPERVSLAYDLEHVRLGLVWRGDFLNLEGTWHGRAGELERPAGHGVMAMPPGPAVALADAPWPDEPGRAAGWRLDGYRRDEEGLPHVSMHHETLDLFVEEHLEPVLDPSAGRLRRRMALRGDDAHLVALRAALAATIEPAAGGGFVTSDGLTVLVTRGVPMLRRGDEGVELLVSPGLVDGRHATLEVELSW